jgi:hypothetical protein
MGRQTVDRLGLLLAIALSVSNGEEVRRRNIIQLPS